MDITFSAFKEIFDGQKIDGVSVNDTLLHKYHRTVVAMEKCYLCSKPPESLAGFVPDESALFGGTRNKLRLILYVLCHECYKRPDWAAALAEDKILAQLRGIVVT